MERDKPSMMFDNVAARAGVVWMEKINHQFDNFAARAGVVYSVDGKDKPSV